MIELTIQPKRVLKNIGLIVLGATTGYYGNDLLDNKTMLEDYTRQQYIDSDGIHLREKGYRMIPKEQLLQQPKQPEYKKG